MVLRPAAHLNGRRSRGNGIPPMAAVFLCLFLMLFAPLPASAAIKITQYQPVFSPYRDAAGVLQLAIRHYLVDGLRHLLLINPATLETTVATVGSMTAAAGDDLALLKASPYFLALDRSLTSQNKLQNAGLTRAGTATSGLFLTVDLCPSRKPFEQEMFAVLAELAAKTAAPVPVAVAITGHWMAHHREETEWLKGEVAARRLAITWVNHSYSHPYDPKAPLDRTFLLTTGVDLQQEVLATEVAMLENGLVPSPFFRFPGLVADALLLKKLRQLSLIPVGSDAWLAKGEAAIGGSIILVHGNGNEPQGIKKLLPLLRQEHLRLLPLRQAVTGT